VFTYNNATIESVSQFKVLGVWFTPDLKWNQHVSKLRQSISWKLGILNRARNLLPIKIKVNLYNALIYSTLYYCHLVWGTTGSNNLNALLVLQKKSLRFIASLRYNDHVTHLFKMYNMIPVHHMYQYKLGLTLRHQNENFFSLFQVSNRVNLFNIRQTSHNFYEIPRSRIIIANSRLNVTVPRLLNIFHTQDIILFQTSYVLLKHKLLSDDCYRLYV